MDNRFDRLDSRIDDVQRSIAQLAVALTAAMLAGFAGICALIAAQL
jgi:hypothetical protein